MGGFFCDFKINMTIEQEIIQVDILPIAEQKPFGVVASESDKWFGYTFPDREEKPFQRSAVVTLAHPDDAEDMVGGTIAKLADEGFDITLVIITDGRWGIDHRNPMSQQDLVRIRLEETLLGAHELGVRKIVNLGIEDREVYEDPKTDKDLLGLLVDVYKENPASLYITHATPENNLTKDYHADHRNTAKLALEGIQRSRNGNGEMNEQPILLYADTQGARNAHGIVRRFGKILPRSANIDFLLDIGSTLQKKEIAFSQHVTQIGNTPEDIAHDYVTQSREVTRFRARQARRKFFRKPTFAEGLSVHTGQGFSTEITRVLPRKDIFIPKRLSSRRSTLIFG